MPLHYEYDFRPYLGDLRTPPLPFGRRPPQSNCLPCTVPDPVKGPRLEPQRRQAGISTLAPPKLAFRLQSLPPILHMSCEDSIPRYSKGARGLSVQSRVSGIFTAATVSPSPLLRQRSSRYTIRAGRNLPDKEFRYLRTVIVTAAVYRGFGSTLRPCGLTNPLNLPAPGRCQSVYVVLRLRTDLCFW